MQTGDNGGEKTHDLSDLGELYHNYKIFGYTNKQLPGIFEPNQKAKAPIINGYIQLAIGKSRETTRSRVSFAELFCADGYYTMTASHFGADECTGIDNGKDVFFEKAPLIAERLGLKNVRFVAEDVANIDRMPKVDIVANVGGLYHVSNPEEILRKSFAMANKFLIVQTVFSMNHESPEYFESPAPGWSWGCRFSLKWLEAQVAALGGTVLDKHWNELEGNEKLEDRGSAYFFIKK